MVYFDREGCTRSMNHNTDNKPHETDKRCKYQHQFENKVFLCKVGSQRDPSSLLYVILHLFNNLMLSQKKKTNTPLFQELSILVWFYFQQLKKLTD